MKIFLICLALAGCANPKYVTPSEGDARTAGTSDVGVEFKPGPGRMSLAWEIKASTQDYGTFLLKIGRPNTADGSLLPEDTPLALNVFLWMPDMGHGSVPVQIDRVDVGTYRVSHVLFVMAGPWEIHVQLKDGNAVRNEAVIPFIL